MFTAIKTGSPARAGIAPRRTGPLARCPRFSRASGDSPTGPRETEYFQKVLPRERG